MTKYTTVEGHIVEVGKKYVDRDGYTHKITRIVESAAYPIRTDALGWLSNGYHFIGETQSQYDLMRPYEEAQSEPDKEEASQLPVEEKQSKSVNDSWIEWRGGECPVDRDVNVQVKLFRVDGIYTGPAFMFDWNWAIGRLRHILISDTNIIAYRVIKNNSENNPKKEIPQFNTSNHWIDYSSKMQFSRPDGVSLEDLVDVEYTNGKREYAALTGGILWADVMKYRVAFSRKDYLKGVESC